MGFTSGKIFLGDSMCYENHRVFCRCRELKRWFWLNSAYFFNNCIYIKVGDNSKATKIKHLSDIKKAVNMENNSYLGIIV